LTEAEIEKLMAVAKQSGALGKKSPQRRGGVPQGLAAGAIWSITSRPLGGSLVGDVPPADEIGQGSRDAGHTQGLEELV
jgi:hypothetical protein